MSQITLDSGSNKKWMVMLGVGMAVVVAAVWWSRQPQASDRVQEAAPSTPVQNSAQAEAEKMAHSPEAAAMVAQQKEAAKVLENQPEMKPIIGPVKERPPYVSQMEWAMLQGVAQQQNDPDKELTRMVNFLRFSKQVELWEALPKTPENAAKRQTLAVQLVDDLPTRVINGELDLKDAQGKLAAFMADAVTDPNLRRQREETEVKHLLAANETYKANEKAAQH
ncbi:MAG: hypothetical protein QM749_11840 [Aquabacterium sp.]